MHIIYDCWNLHNGRINNLGLL